jgi:nitroimidazol reductase NimA-like FMN-containing flavoprotein (pyridoxamine 5'-phosphate oxidase superfamily)
VARTFRANNGVMTDPPPSAVEELDAAACWALLPTVSLGRIAVAVDDGVDIYPVNFLVRDRTIYFSSAPGTKMEQITAHPRVAFEVDGTTERRRWSVVVRGNAVRLDTDREIEESGVQTLHSLPPTDKWNYVRIDPEVITGRRFVSARRRSSLSI